MDPHIRSKPLYALRTEVSCWQPRKPSSSAGQTFWRPLQRPTLCAGVFTGHRESYHVAEGWQVTWYCCHPSKSLSARGEAVLDKLQDLFKNCWEKGTLPPGPHGRIYYPSVQNKGENSDCSNYQGITLHSIAGKILAHILWNRLIPTIAQLVS